MPGYRARVYSAAGASGRYWWYEIINPRKDDGCQIVLSGVRPTWERALVAACQALRQLAT